MASACRQLEAVAPLATSSVTCHMYYQVPSLSFKTMARYWRSLWMHHSHFLNRPIKSWSLMRRSDRLNRKCSLLARNYGLRVNLMRSRSKPSSTGRGRGCKMNFWRKLVARTRRWTSEISTKLPWPNRSTWISSRMLLKSVTNSRRAPPSTLSSKSANARKDWPRKTSNAKKRSARERKRRDSDRGRNSKSSF